MFFFQYENTLPFFFWSGKMLYTKFYTSSHVDFHLGLEISFQGKGRENPSPVEPGTVAQIFFSKNPGFSSSRLPRKQENST